MGTSTSLDQVAAKVGQVQRAFDGRELERIVNRVGLKEKPIATAAINPNTLSHWGRGAKKGGYRVEARYKPLGGPEVAIFPTVPPLAALLEFGSGTTWKAPRRRGGPRRRKGSVGTYTRSPVPPRNAWSKAEGPIRASAPRFVDEEVQRVLRGIF